MGNPYKNQRQKKGKIYRKLLVEDKIYRWNKKEERLQEQKEQKKQKTKLKRGRK